MMLIFRRVGLQVSVELKLFNTTYCKCLCCYCIAHCVCHLLMTAVTRPNVYSIASNRTKDRYALVVRKVHTHSGSTYDSTHTNENKLHKQH